MPINIEYICDQCNKTIEWSYHTVENTTIKQPAVTHDMFLLPQPKEIFCSMECLGKRHEWWAKRYDEVN